MKVTLQSVVALKPLTLVTTKHQLSVIVHIGAVVQPALVDSYVGVILPQRLEGLPVTCSLWNAQVCCHSYELLLQHSDVGNIQDVIATLEYDIQAVKKKIHMEEIQGTTLLSIVLDSIWSLLILHSWNEKPKRHLHWRRYVRTGDVAVVLLKGRISSFLVHPRHR